MTEPLIERHAFDGAVPTGEVSFTSMADALTSGGTPDDPQAGKKSSGLGRFFGLSKT